MIGLNYEISSTVKFSQLTVIASHVQIQRKKISSHTVVFDRQTHREVVPTKEPLLYVVTFCFIKRLLRKHEEPREKAK